MASSFAGIPLADVAGCLNAFCDVAGILGSSVLLTCSMVLTCSLSERRCEIFGYSSAVRYLVDRMYLLESQRSTLIR